MPFWRRRRDDDPALEQAAPEIDPDAVPAGWEPDPADFEDDEPAEAEDEEQPVFLSHRGRLLMFKSPESLVSFIRICSNVSIYR